MNNDDSLIFGETDFFISFTIGKEIFAVSIDNVLEVIINPQITDVPGAPDSIQGVLNFRGDILPVVKLRHKFNLPESDSEKINVVVFEIPRKDKILHIGAVVDKVNDVLDFSGKKLTDAPKEAITYNAEYIKGMVKTDDGEFVIILKPEKVILDNQSNEDIKKAMSKAESKKK